jgi:class 3 adenylate cyclase
MIAQLDEKLLDERLAALEAVRAWSPRLVSKLESHLRSAPDEALFRINPLTFASERNLSETETIDLFLHATNQRLVEMNWLLVCPLCSCVVESFKELKGVHNHYYCNVCQAGFTSRLDEFVAVTFTVLPTIRTLKYHRPEELSPGEYFLEYGAIPDGRLPDGTPFVKAQAAVARAASHLPPGETTPMSIEAGEGTVIGVSHEGGAALLYAIEGAPAAQPQRFEIEFGEPVRQYATGKVAPGAMTFAVTNTTGERGTFVLAVLPPGFVPGQPLHFVPFLTGKRLLTTQTFRDLFRSEVIRASEGLSVTDITLLFTDLKGSTALYDRIGDLNAFALVHQHFERLQAVTVRHGGAIIKTIGDAVMAAFLSPADAVQAALEMRGEIAAFNRDRPDRELVLKIGIHKGAAIAVTLNDRLDYFGQTVNIAARVQALADADEIFVSEDVFEAEGVAPALAGWPVDKQLAKLRGIQDGLNVHRVAAAPVAKVA